jgi:hypothetical protein
MKMLSETSDSTNVGVCGSFGVIAALEFLEHLFSELGHRDLLVTHTLAGCYFGRTLALRVASAARAAQFKRSYRRSGFRHVPGCGKSPQTPLRVR